MNASGINNSIPFDIKADVPLIAEYFAAGKPVPDEVARRVHARAEQVRQEILDKHGVQDIGVQIIRELRGELPQP